MPIRESRHFITGFGEVNRYVEIMNTALHVNGGDSHAQQRKNIIWGTFDTENLPEIFSATALGTSTKDRLFVYPVFF